MVKKEYDPEFPGFLIWVGGLAILLFCFISLYNSIEKHKAHVERLTKENTQLVARLNDLITESGKCVTQSYQLIAQSDRAMDTMLLYIEELIVTYGELEKFCDIAGTECLDLHQRKDQLEDAVKEIKRVRLKTK